MLLKCLEKLNKMMTGEVPGPPIAQLLGIEIAGLEKGRVILEMEASEKYTIQWEHFMVVCFVIYLI